MRYKLTTGYLYGDLMNIYGDRGNIICLQKRCQWRGIETKVKNISIGDKFKRGQVDIYFFGGGQDQSQNLVGVDLIKSGKGKEVIQDVERGVPLLSICGGYQLLGAYYKPHKGPKIPGISLFPTYTIASNQRMIGNLVIDSEKFGKLIGFENHSGKTFLKDGGQPLGKVIKGFGNNGEDKLEGCIYKNAIGCYIHGSLLPKNPELADWLIGKALETKYNQIIKLSSLDDSLEKSAHTFAISRLG